MITIHPHAPDQAKRNDRQQNVRAHRVPTSSLLKYENAPRLGSFGRFPHEAVDRRSLPSDT